MRMPRLLITGSAILCLLAGAMSVSAAPDLDYVYEGTLSYGDSIQDAVTTIEGDIWYFNGQAGDVVSIFMQSGEMDSYLNLWSPDVALLTANDDYGGTLNSFIQSYSLPVTGRYLIGAGGVGDQTGSYSLELVKDSSGGSTGGSSGGSTGGSSSGQGNNTSQQYSVDVWDPDDINDVCPTGSYCLRNESFRWSTNNLDYCVAPQTGWWITVGGHNFAVYGGMEDNVSLATMVGEATAYWSGLTSFRFSQLSSCDYADVIFGWADPVDVAGSEGTTYTDPCMDLPLGYSTSINSEPKQFAIVMNRGCNWDRAAGNFNWDAANTLAHELGHSLGIGHDETSGTLMYPSNGSMARLSSATLGDDTENQLATTYPGYVSWASTRAGFSIDRFEATNGRPVTISLPYPAGATNVYANCYIEGYVPFDDDGEDKDMGWSCGWRYDNTNRVAYFTLTPQGSDAGTIYAKAVLFDNDVYRVVQNFSFVAESEGTFGGVIQIHPTEFTDLFNGGTFGELYVQNLPANTIPVITLPNYIPSGDDDFSYWITADPINGFFDALGWMGGGSSYVSGYINFIQPQGRATLTSCFVSGGNNQNQTLTFPGGNCTASVVQPGWNTGAFSSLIGYSTNETDYYAPLLSLAVTDAGGGGGNINLSGYLWTAEGDSMAGSSWQVIILQTP